MLVSVCHRAWRVMHLTWACCCRILLAVDSHSLISVGRPSGAMVSPDGSGRWMQAADPWGTGCASAMQGTALSPHTDSGVAVPVLRRVASHHVPQPRVVF